MMRFVEFLDFVCRMSYEVFKENSLAKLHGLHIALDLYLDKLFPLADQTKLYSFFFPSGELKNLDLCVDDEEEITGYFTY